MIYEIDYDLNDSFYFKSQWLESMKIRETKPLDEILHSLQYEVRYQFIKYGRCFQIL